MEQEKKSITLNDKGHIYSYTHTHYYEKVYKRNGLTYLLFTPRPHEHMDTHAHTRMTAHRIAMPSKNICANIWHFIILFIYIVVWTMRMFYSAFFASLRFFYSMMCPFIYIVSFSYGWPLDELWLRPKPWIYNASDIMMLSERYWNNDVSKWNFLLFLFWTGSSTYTFFYTIPTFHTHTHTHIRIRKFTNDGEWKFQSISRSNNSLNHSNIIPEMVGCLRNVHKMIA